MLFSCHIFRCWWSKIHRLQIIVIPPPWYTVCSRYIYVLFFIDVKSFQSHYGPGVDSASDRNEYQEYFLGVKAAGA